MILKEAGSTEYGSITKVLGNLNFEVKCYDNVTRIAHIRNVVKRIKFAIGDIVLVSLRSFQDKRGDLIHRYSPEEVRALKNKFELPEDVCSSSSGSVGIIEEENVVFDFDSI